MTSPATQRDDPRALIDYPLVDADCHYYEPDDCYTRHMESRFRADAITVVRGLSTHAQVHFRGRRLTRIFHQYKVGTVLKPA